MLTFRGVVRKREETGRWHPPLLLFRMVRDHLLRARMVRKPITWAQIGAMGALPNLPQAAGKGAAFVFSVRRDPPCCATREPRPASNFHPPFTPDLHPSRRPRRYCPSHQSRRETVLAHA